MPSARSLGLLLVLVSLQRVDASGKRCVLRPGRRPCIQTTVGTVRGLTTTVRVQNGEANATTNVYTFLGIPYAKPPVNKLRFRRPVPHPRLPHDIRALRHKPPCWQLHDTSYNSSKAQQIWLLPKRPRMSEDCLYLNVWVPELNLDEKKAFKSGIPIMVWIYGGSFTTGTASLKVYDGRYLAGRQKVIVASMNYRLGPHGFLYLGTDEAPGNMGLWDQREALIWIKRNARQFGGDPTRITLFGESAGAVSVGLHVISPYSHNYFTNAIMQSGSALCSWGTINRQRAFKRSVTFIEEFIGCKNRTLVAKMRCLRSKANEDIDNAHLSLYSSSMFFHVPMPPVLDGLFLPYNDYDLFQTMKFFKPSGSFLFGMNKNEASYFLLYKFITAEDWRRGHRELRVKTRQEFQRKLRTMFAFDNGPASASLTDFAVTLTAFEYERVDTEDGEQKFLDMLESVAGDCSFKCPTVQMAENALKARTDVEHVTPVYFYQFDHRTTSMPWPKWMGTPHGYEIEYVFGMPFDDDFQRRYYKFNDKERRLSHLVMTYWANFARSGDPNLSMDGRLCTNEPYFELWPEFNRKQHYLKFGKDAYLTHSYQPLQRKCRFWDIHFRAMVEEGRRIAEEKANASCRAAAAATNQFASTRYP